jgi:hypothetical protein
MLYQKVQEVFSKYGFEYVGNDLDGDVELGEEKVDPRTVDCIEIWRQSGAEEDLGFDTILYHSNNSNLLDWNKLVWGDARNHEEFKDAEAEEVLKRLYDFY